MLTKLNLEKIDKFYFALFGVLALLAVVVIFTFQTLFSVMVGAYEVEVDSSDTDLRVDKESLESAYDYIFKSEMGDNDLEIETSDTVELDL